MLKKPWDSENTSCKALSPDSLSPATQRSVDEIQSRNLTAAMPRLFSMKKHNATRLHYDLRLAHNGVLKSWAVPAGPSYFPGHQREAIQVEDHRREYAFFEGVIRGKPGAGTVMQWDWGTWEPFPDYTDVDACLRNGPLRFILHGEKLEGIWVLIRLKRFSRNRRSPIWLLIKEQDSFARGITARNIVEESPHSISTQRTLEEIAQDWTRGKPKNKLQGELFDE